MVTADDLRPFRGKGGNFRQADELKRCFAILKHRRRPFCLNEEETNKIFRWKLRGQYGRSEKRRKANKPADYCRVTRECFEISCPENPDEEARRRFACLQKNLWGVGIGVASAVLVLVDPDDDCVIDFRGWRGAFCEVRKQFSVKRYIQYRNEVRRLARELGWCIQETDAAIWQRDYELHPPPKQRC